MSRPPSGRPMSATTKGMKHPRGDVISYEDLLVAQYLEELRKAPNKNSVQPLASPYSQKVAFTHIVPTPKFHGESIRPRRMRPHSAGVVLRPQSAGKPKMDPKFIADPDMYDPITPREQRRKKQRPFSAPSHRRPLSATYGSSRPSSAKSSVYGRRARSQYKKSPMTIVATAYKNGSRDVSCRVAAPNIKMLLEICTDRLGLPHAARKVFLANGLEVTVPQQIQRDAEIYISMGEKFKNAFKNAEKHTEIQRNLAWTLNGLAWYSDAKRRSTKPQLSKRMQQMLEPSKRRVLVFKNGSFRDGAEVVADPERFEDFLVACTDRLQLESYARVLYNWNGEEVHDLLDAPQLDGCLQAWATPVHGPLWVSKGEGFSPKGAAQFFTQLLRYNDAKRKEAKHYESQLRMALHKESRENVKIAAILSMSEDEIEEALKVVSRDIFEFTEALSHLKEEIKPMLEMEEKEKEYEEETKESYKYKYLKEYGIDGKLVGKKGIKLKVYINGSLEDEAVVYFNVAQATRGVGNDPEKLMARLLDECSSHQGLLQPKANTKIRPVAQKLFDNLGNEILHVHELHTDQQVWLSFGEAWKNPYTFVLAIQVDKIRGFDVQGQKRSAIREQLHSEDVKDMAVDGNDKMSNWEVITGVPETHDWIVIGLDADAGQKAEIMSQLETEIDVNSDFLVSKNNPSMVLYAEPIFDTKRKRGSKEIWPSDSQQWFISKHDGHLMIHSKYHKNLVLGVSQYPIAATLGHPLLGRTETKVEGYLVNVQRRVDGPAQYWNFTEHGCIESVQWPELRLTYLGTRFGDEETHAINEKEGVPRGMKNYIAVCQKLTGKDAKSQRWALKQEKIENLGQWKHTQTDSSEWKKLAYSWPVDTSGKIVEDYDWPMEGFLLPYAPPFKVSEKKDDKEEKNRLPLRLMTLKNGVRDVAKAIAVVGPDLRNMKKDVSGSKVDRKNKKNKQMGEIESSIGTGENGWIQHEDDLTVLKLEFILFLERCTSLLNLPFAARRIYDETGKEHFSLKSFSRDQLVFISCGEPWSDPNLSKAEQQRRYLLANLGSDVAKIAQFIALRDPTDLVLEAEALSPGSKVIINRSDPAKTLEKQTLLQQQANKAAVKDEFQEFDFDPRTGYISCKAEPQLVIGLSRADSNGLEVVTLQKRQNSNTNQRWAINNGMITAKATGRVLTAVIPSDVKVKDDGTPQSFVGGKVAIQHPKQMGQENQMWSWNPSTGKIRPYANNKHDLTLQVESMAPGAMVVINHQASKKMGEETIREEDTNKGDKKVLFNPKGQQKNSQKQEDQSSKGPTSGDFQVFEFDPKGGYIFCGGIPQLVLGIDANRVVVQQRTAKNVNQQWSMGDGVITSKASSQLLTVMVPKDIQTNVDGFPGTYSSCELSLQNKKQHERGNQLWSYDGERKNIEAFNTSGNKEIVLEVESLSVGSRLVANQRKPQQKEKKIDHHAIAHKASEKRLNEMKYPWERTTDVRTSNDAQVNSSFDTSARRSRTRRYANVTELQEFVYDVKEGYIHCAADPQLVLGIKEAEGSLTEVNIQRRLLDDINQRWLMDNGLITAKSSGKVLTVVMPSDVLFDEDGQPLSYVGCEVALQARKKTAYGRANQIWHYDQETKLIEAFFTDDIKDKEITAANKANVCTFAVMGDVELDQPGYQVDLPTKNGPKLLKVCSACARAMRGRHKLDCITGKLKFACGMGKAKEYGIKQIGSFQCLNGKVKLSTNDAKHTLDEWEKQLEKLKQELSVRTIAKKISEAEPPPTVKVLAYKNGAGRMKDGELIIGSSVPSILNQATYRLGLNQAARRVYTADGYLVLDLRDLIHWVQENYVEQARFQLRDQARAKKGGRLKNTNLFNNVSLEEDSDEYEDEYEDAGTTNGYTSTTSKSDPTPPPSGTTLGYDILPDRKKLDEKISRCMLIPNPNERVKKDGYIQTWNFYCVKTGKLYLQVVRPDGSENYNLVQQVDFDIQETGEYSINMAELPNTPWSGKGIPVKKGDIIGFYCPAECMLSYDLDPSAKQDPLFFQTPQGAPPPKQNTSIKLRKWTQDGTRKYSLNAFILENVPEKTSTDGFIPGDETIYGFEVSQSRQKYDDKISRCMLIPNPDKKIVEDGFIHSWNFFCIKTGKLYLQVLRPIGTTEFRVVQQADFDIEQVGEYSVNMADLADTPWYGTGIPVEKGDMLGFYCPGECMLNYDVDTSVTQHPMFYQTKPGAPPPQEKEVIKMSKWTQDGTRQYSLNACVRGASKRSSSLAPPAQQKRSQSSEAGTRITKEKKESKVKGPHVETPPIELVLKYPIEVWVSSGEPFVQPEEVERQLVISKQQREKRAALTYELEKEKHVLRQMQGRRLDEMSSGQFKATMNPTHPVLIDGHWQAPTPDEQEKHHTVHQLQTDLSDMKTAQKPKQKIYNPDTTRRLYTQPAMKRILVFPNGESISRAVYIWGETIQQLLDNSTDRLSLRKAARYIFKMDGTPVTDMDEIDRDEVICVSYGKNFMRPKESQQNVEIKANWGRARKTYGENATDIVVEAKENPGIDVDPFGPSNLVGNKMITEKSDDAS